MGRLLDPKAMAAASASAAASAAAAFDPKLLASAGIDPKMFGIDPKTMASLASMDPKELAKLDPTLAALYGLPPGGTSTHNGVSKSSSSNQGKPKPGTVAAALEEKKKAAAAAAEAAAAVKNSSNHDQEADKTKDNLNQVDTIQEAPNAPMTAASPAVDPSAPAPSAKQQNGGANLESISENNAENKTMTSTNTDNEGTDNEGSTKGGLTSEERVLLREKKKARLQKEQDQLSQETCQNNQELNFGDGHSESGAEGSATEGDGTEGSARGRLTRSGRRKGLGKLDAVVDKLQDGTNEAGTEANEDS